MNRFLLTMVMLVAASQCLMAQQPRSNATTSQPAADNNDVKIGMEVQVRTRRELETVSRQLAILAKLPGIAVTITIAGQQVRYEDAKEALKAMEVVESALAKPNGLAGIKLPGGVGLSKEAQAGPAGVGLGALTPDMQRQIEAEMKLVEQRTSKRIGAGEAGIPPNPQKLEAIFRDEVERSKQAGKLPYDFNPAFGAGVGFGFGRAGAVGGRK